MIGQIEPSVKMFEVDTVHRHNQYGEVEKLE